jgi:hypothetical protein
MVETTDLRNHDDLAGRRCVGRSVIGRILREAEVRSTPMIVPAVGAEDSPKMRLVEDDDMIEAFSSDRADQAFGVRSAKD